MSFKEYLNESSLSRVWKHSLDNDTGTISAFRSASNCNEGEEYTKAQNKKNSKLLKSKLLSLGYGVTRIAGTYIENYKSSNEIEVKEESYLVVDLKDSGNLKKDLIKLGQEFEQDSITFQKNNGGDYYLISSNKCENGYPGNGKVGVEIKLGKPLFGKDGEFHSKINGRPFVFETVQSNFKQLTDFYPTEIRSIKENAKLDKI